MRIASLGATKLAFVATTLLGACGGKVLSEPSPGASEPRSSGNPPSSTQPPPNAPNAPATPSTPSTTTLDEACKAFSDRATRCGNAWDGWVPTCFADSRRPDCGPTAARWYICIADNASTCDEPAACRASYCEMVRCSSAPGVYIPECL